MCKTITILAEDFKDNYFNNLKDGLEGCPMERALYREGINWEHIKTTDRKEFNEAHRKIFDMFKGVIPIETFSVEINVK